MQHLSGEDLARLADGEAAGGEALHLERCAECRMEVEGYRAQLRSLAGLPELPPPAGGWEALSGKLAEERLIGARRVGWSGGWVLRIAAALILFAGGAATGALAMRAAGPPTAAAPDREAAPAGPEERLREAEARYIAALTEYSESVGAHRATNPLNRLAALEGIVLTTRAALEDAPADPVINGYHLSALAQRDAMLRQIDAGESAEESWF